MSCHRMFLSAVLALGASCGTLSADTIRLEGGGVVRGQILDERSTKDLLVVKLQIGGAEVSIDRSRVLSIAREKNPVAEYEEIKGQYADTVEDQFKLALWCEEHKLARQRREHLQRVIELDPEHERAREKLGYVRRDGKWLSPNELKEARGLVRFNGRYVTPQEKEILEQKKREDGVVREWHQRIRMWKNWMTGNDPVKAKQGEDQLRAIEDAQALDAVVGQLGKESSESLRVLMCDILGNLPGEPASLELVKRSISDVSSDVRWTAVDRLVEREDPAAVRALIKALSSDHNAMIRRAADALGALGDPSAVAPLINVLVTKHKQVVTRQIQTSSFGIGTPYVVDQDVVVAPGSVAVAPRIGYVGNGVGISVPKQEIVVIPVENQEVLDALRAITEQDFGYDQASWRRWWAAQMRREEDHNRRKLEER